MRLVHWLFHLDDLVPYEVTHRRARPLRAVAVAVLITILPGAFVAYHQERLQPLVDQLTEHIQEVAEQGIADEQSQKHQRRDLFVWAASRPGNS
ncbi:MAG: hypothetical protein WD638_11165 [Nitriliruptoraceae bacterium]